MATPKGGNGTDRWALYHQAWSLALALRSKKAWLLQYHLAGEVAQFLASFKRTDDLVAFNASLASAPGWASRGLFCDSDQVHSQCSNFAPIFIGTHTCRNGLRLL
jgi:hypothetical protein